MRHQDLVRLATREVRIAFLLLFAVLGGLALALTGALDELQPNWSGPFLVPILAGLGIVLVAALAMRGGLRIPRCPHCKRLLTGWLVHIAIASGNCGYCGKSIED